MAVILLVGIHLIAYYLLHDKMGICFFTLLWQHKDHHHITSNKKEFTIERYIEDKPSIQLIFHTRPKGSHIHKIWPIVWCPHPLFSKINKTIVLKQQNLQKYDKFQDPMPLLLRRHKYMVPMLWQVHNTNEWHLFINFWNCTI